MDEAKRKKIVVLGIVDIVLCLLLYGTCLWFATGVLTATKKTALADMEQHLSDIEQHLSEIDRSAIGSIPEDNRPGNCRMLYYYMATNDNQYTLTVNEVHEYGEQVSLFVDFPDGSRVEANFYQASLSSCWVLDEEGNRQGIPSEQLLR